MTFYNVSSKSKFIEALSAGIVGRDSIAFIKDTREIWAQGTYYPCDFSAPQLSSAPTSTTFTYTDSEGYVRTFAIGQACVYPNVDLADGYGIAFLKAIEDGTAIWQDLGDALNKVNEAVATSEEANAYAKAAYANSNEAVNTANVAKAAVATLEGLANTDEAQTTLAGQVTQIAQNTSDIAQLQEQHIVLPQSEYDALELKDETKIYMITEDEEN